MSKRGVGKAVSHARRHQKNFELRYRSPKMSTSLSGKGLLLKADLIAAAFRDEVEKSLAECSRSPKLVGILSTSSGPSRTYAEFTRKQCESLGFEFVLKETGAALMNGGLGEGEGVEEAIMEANEDDSVDGVMVSPV